MKHYLSIKPGETKVIKKSAKILSVINYGGVNSTTTCGALPAAENALCYEIGWTVNRNTVGNHVLEYTSTTLDYIEILGIKYNINILAANYTDILEKIRLVVPDSLMHSVSYGNNTLDELYKIWFYFQTIPNVADSIIYYFTSGSEFPTGFFIKPKVVTCPPSA